MITLFNENLFLFHFLFWFHKKNQEHVTKLGISKEYREFCKLITWCEESSSKKLQKTTKSPTTAFISARPGQSNPPIYTVPKWKVKGEYPCQFENTKMLHQTRKAQKAHSKIEIWNTRFEIRESRFKIRHSISKLTDQIMDMKICILAKSNFSK